MNLSPAQIHLLLNHVPVIGSVGVLIVLVVALIRRNEDFTRLALGLALLVALVTIPVFRSGEPAEKRVEHMPGVTERVIDEHEEMAKIAFGAILLLGVLSAFALGVRRGRRLPGWVTPRREGRGRREALTGGSVTGTGRTEVRASRLIGLAAV